MVKDGEGGRSSTCRLDMQYSVEADVPYMVPILTRCISWPIISISRVRGDAHIINLTECEEMHILHWRQRWQ
jgi:hypothetical protein